MALNKFGARRITNYEDSSDKTNEAIVCRLHFEQTAKSLMRSHWWRFAKTRAILSQDTVSPVFQWTYAYHLPADFLRAIRVYDGSDLVGGQTYDSYELEGTRLLIDASSVNLKYIKWVDNVVLWDPLFVELFILVFARKLIAPLSQDAKLAIPIERELAELMPRIRAMDRQEGEHVGRTELRTWREARFSDYA